MVQHVDHSMINHTKTKLNYAKYRSKNLKNYKPPLSNPKERDRATIFPRTNSFPILIRNIRYKYGQTIWVDREKQLSLQVFAVIINYRKNVNGLPTVGGIHHLDLVSCTEII